MKILNVYCILNVLKANIKKKYSKLLISMTGFKDINT